MAVHISLPPAGAEAFVRGDPATFVLRFRVDEIDLDISAWAWRCHLRTRLDGELVSECNTFEVATPDDMLYLWPELPGTTRSVLLAHWTIEQTKLWQGGYCADVEQLTPNKRTWVIIDSIRVDKDVSYTEVEP